MGEVVVKIEVNAGMGFAPGKSICSTASHNNMSIMVNFVPILYTLVYLTNQCRAAVIGQNCTHAAHTKHGLIFVHLVSLNVPAGCGSVGPKSSHSNRLTQVYIDHALQSLVALTPLHGLFYVCASLWFGSSLHSLWLLLAPLLVVFVLSRVDNRVICT